MAEKKKVEKERSLNMKENLKMHTAVETFF